MSGKSVLESGNERGTVLFAALAILSILAVTITGVLIFGGWHHTQGVLCLEEVRVRSLAESGIHHAIAELAMDSSHTSRDQRVILDSANQISYSIRPWGAYLQVRSTGIGRRLARTLIAIVGMRPPDIFDHVLSPIGSPYPLVVSGNTRIRGNIYVGSGGITGGEINGRGFQGDRLVDGIIDTLDSAKLPRFEGAVLAEFLNSLERMKNEIPASDYSLVYRNYDELSELPAKGVSAVRTLASIEFNVSDSYAIEDPQYFFAGQTIQVLGQTHLTNLVLASREVVVAHQSRLDNCVIVADKVRLTDGATFSGQIIGTDTVRIESHARLDHPALVLLRGRRQEEKIVGDVEISSLSSLRATVISGTDYGLDNRESQATAGCRLRILDHSTLRGLIWWQGLVDLDGVLEGAAAVNLFSHYVPPTTYMNWLVDADVRYLDVASLSAFPVVLEHRGRPKLCRMIGSIAQ